MGFWTPAPTFNLGDTKSFKAGLMVNGKDEASGDITFNVQIADDAASAAKLGEEAPRPQPERAEEPSSGSSPSTRTSAGRCATPIAPSK